MKPHSPFAGKRTGKGKASSLSLHTLEDHEHTSQLLNLAHEKDDKRTVQLSRLRLIRRHGHWQETRRASPAEVSSVSSRFLLQPDRQCFG